MTIAAKSTASSEEKLARPERVEFRTY